MKTLRVVGLICALVAVSIALRAANGPRVLVVVNKLGDTIAFFDTGTQARLSTIPVATHPHEIVVAPDGRTAYVSIYGDGVYGRNANPAHTIVVLDLAGRKKIGEIDLGAFRAPHAMAFDPRGRLWVACDTSAAVVVVDPKARTVVGSVPTESTGSHWLAMLPDGSKAYTSNKDTTHLTVIDVPSMKAIGTIAMPNGSDGLAVSRDGRRLFVADLREPVLRVVDTATDREVATVTLKARAMRVRLTPDERLLLLSDSGANAVEVVDAASLISKGAIAVGKAPMGFAFPGPDHKAYVTNHNDGTISFIDPDALTVLATFPSDAGPETMVLVDP